MSKRPHSCVKIQVAEVADFMNGKRGNAKKVKVRPLEPAPRAQPAPEISQPQGTGPVRSERKAHTDQSQKTPSSWWPGANQPSEKLPHQNQYSVADTSSCPVCPVSPIRDSELFRLPSYSEEPLVSPVESVSGTYPCIQAANESSDARPSNSNAQNDRINQPSETHLSDLDAQNRSTNGPPGARSSGLSAKKEPPVTRTSRFREDLPPQKFPEDKHSTESSSQLPQDRIPRAKQQKPEAQMRKSEQKDREHEVEKPQPPHRSAAVHKNNQGRFHAQERPRSRDRPRSIEHPRSRAASSDNRSHMDQDIIIHQKGAVWAVRPHRTEQDDVDQESSESQKNHRDDTYQKLTGENPNDKRTTRRDTPPPLPPRHDTCRPCQPSDKKPPGSPVLPIRRDKTLPEPPRTGILQWLRKMYERLRLWYFAHAQKSERQ